MAAALSEALVNCRVITSGTVTGNLAVVLRDGKIDRVVPRSEVPAEAAIVDLAGAWLSPAFLDLQVYGSGGLLFGGDPSVSALAQMESDFRRQGTLGFFATVATNANDVVERAISTAKSYRAQANGIFLGLHLEGPYLNPVRRGAHPAGLIKKGNIDEVKKWVDVADGEIRMMTVAPELQDDSLLQWLTDNGVILSCGHSDASYDEAMRFFRGTIPAATHLYNAMPPIHHRQPGLVPAIFHSKPYTSIVADGVHVAFAMIALAKQLLGDKLFLITDAVTATSAGIYPHVFRGDRYAMPDGTLSGSCLTMLKAVQNCVEHAGIALEEAVDMASLFPARLIGKSGSTGRIEPGFEANLVAFDDSFAVKQVWHRGVPVHPALNKF